MSSFTAFAQLKLVQPDFKPNGNIVYLNMDNRFEIEGEGEIVDVETNKGTIKEKNAKGFTFVVTEINDVSINFVVTYKHEKGSSRVKYPTSFRARSLPTYPILFNDVPTGGVVSKANIANPTLTVFAGYCMLKAEPIIKSMNVIKTGSNTVVVKIENNDFANNEQYKKLIKKLNEGDQLEFTDIKLSIGDLEQEAMPITVTVGN